MPIEQHVWCFVEIHVAVGDVGDRRLIGGSFGKE